MPFKSEKQRRYLWANEPKIARDWSDKYGSRVKKQGGGRIPFANGSSTFSPGIEQILAQNKNFGWDQNAYKTGIMNQYTDIASQYNQPVTYADSPVFQAGFEKWNPSSLSSVFAAATQKAKSGLGLQTAAAAAPFGGGLYVPPIENVIQDYPKSLKTQKELGESDWATQFGHEASHLGWEYENPLKQIQSISPHLKAEATNPSYAGEEQWNYMHDLMYGPRYDEELLGRPGEKYLTTKELINPGDLSYTPKAFDIISKSGLIPEHKKALGFGVNPFEDTRAAGIYKDDDEKGTIIPNQRVRKTSMLPFSIPPMLMKWMKAKAQGEGIGRIRAQIQARNLAKKKAAMRQQVADAEQQRLQARVTAQANRGAAERVARGEARDYGHTQTRSSSGWRSDPFAQGGLVSLWPR